MGGNIQEKREAPLMRVVQGGSRPAFPSVQAKAIMPDGMTPAMRERGRQAIAGLEKILEDCVFSRQEKGFEKCLVELKGAIAGLLGGSAPKFEKYDNAAERLVSRNHEIRIALDIEDGAPALCPEIESAIGTMLYMMKESDITKKVGMRIGKEEGGARQIIQISGSGIKNLGSNLLPAVRSAVELLGCEFRPNGSSVTILVPLQQDGVPLAI